MRTLRSSSLGLVVVTLATALAAAACDGGTSATSGQGGAGGLGGAGGSGGAGGAIGGEGGVGGLGGQGGAAGGAGGAAGGAGGVGGQAFDCSAIPSGPFVATQLATGFQGAEDLAFDGEGHIALKDGDKLVLLDAAGAVTDLASNVPDAYGLRFRADGHLVVALPGEAKLIDVAPDGTVVDLATGLGGPNGVHVDFDGTVYVTEFGGSKVTRVSPSGELTPLVTGSAAFAANGVVLDPARALLFFTNYQSGVIRSLDLSVPGASPVEVITLAGTAPDGLSLDACGHLYVVDQANADLYRVRLDPSGAATGEPELLASAPQNVANAQFGRGPGFDPLTIYLSGNPGRVFAVPVGVPGAAQP